MFVGLCYMIVWRVLQIDRTSGKNWKSSCCGTNSPSFGAELVRPTITAVDRRFLAAASRLLSSIGRAI